MIDTEFEFRGAYYPAFFSVFLNGDFDIEFSSMSIVDIGTLAHEYCHYLQNIDTFNGLSNSQFFHVFINEIKLHITNQEELDIPIINFNLSDTTIRNKERFDFNKGSFNTKQIDYDSCNIGFDSNDNVILSFYKNEAIFDSVTFGSLCVKEGMAHFFQQIFDSKVEHATVPYLATEVICNKIYPEILTNKTRIIILSYLSLNSLNPGKTFVDLLIISNRNYYRSMSDLDYYYSLKSDIQVKINENTYTIDEAKHFALEKLYDVILYSLVSEMSYFSEIFVNIEAIINRKLDGFIEILTTSTIDSVQKLSLLFETYGSPNIRTIGGKNIFPNSSNELIELVGQRLVLNRIIQGVELCDYFQFCNIQKVEITDFNCGRCQWLRQVECPFTLTSTNWGLTERIKSR